VRLHTERCHITNEANQTLKLNDAHFDVNALARAGLNALKYPDKPPYNYFFKPENAEYVQGALERLLKYTEDPGSLDSLVDIDCNNGDLCDQNPKSDQWGSTSWTGNVEESTWTVTLCPYTLNTLERNQPSCTTSPGVPSLAWVMVKQLVEMWNVIAVAGDNIHGPANCHKLVTDPKGDPTRNAENWAYFTSWAYDMGFSADKPCWDHWTENPQIVLPTGARQGITS
ncbi:MAG: hypothetical protein Q9224_005637, partial [Gallowayella concinna]